MKTQRRMIEFNPRTGKFRVAGKGEVDRQGVLFLIASASDALAKAGLHRSARARRRIRAKT